MKKHINLIAYDNYETIDSKEAIEKYRKEKINGVKGSIEFIQNIFLKKPLTGVPYSAKDVFCTKGTRTTACSNILKNFVPPYDATVVKNLRAKGMVLTGKVNTDEFTCGASTETSCFGTTHNLFHVFKSEIG